MSEGNKDIKEPKGTKRLKIGSLMINQRTLYLFMLVGILGWINAEKEAVEKHLGELWDVVRGEDGAASKSRPPQKVAPANRDNKGSTNGPASGGEANGSASSGGWNAYNRSNEKLSRDAKNGGPTTHKPRNPEQLGTDSSTGTSVNVMKYNPPGDRDRRPNWPPGSTPPGSERGPDEPRNEDTVTNFDHGHEQEPPMDDHEAVTETDHEVAPENPPVVVNPLTHREVPNSSTRTYEADQGVGHEGGPNQPSEGLESDQDDGGRPNWESQGDERQPEDVNYQDQPAPGDAFSEPAPVDPNQPASP